jgi:hypothetical protein
MDGSVLGRRRGPGQVLVVFAVFLAVGVLILQLSLFLYSALRQKAAAEEVARAAARAGCMQPMLDPPVGDRPRLDAQKAVDAAQVVLERGLPYLPYGLSGGKTVDDIIAGADVHAVDASPGFPQTSPITGRQYDRPFVYVCFTVPTEAFFFPVDIRVCAEDAVEVRP